MLQMPCQIGSLGAMSGQDYSQETINYGIEYPSNTEVNDCGVPLGRLGEQEGPDEYWEPDVSSGEVDGEEDGRKAAQVRRWRVCGRTAAR